MPETTSSGSLKLKGSHKALVALMAVFIVGVIFFVFFSKQGVLQIYRLRQEHQQLELENARLAQENARLVRTIDRLQHDPEMIQDLIRQELNFVKKNEIIIQFPERGQAVPLPPAKEDPPPSQGKGAKLRPGPKKSSGSP